MPAKELETPCVDCGDAEFVVDVRSRRLCQYVAFLQIPDGTKAVANMKSYFT